MNLPVSELTNAFVLMCNILRSRNGVTVVEWPLIRKAETVDIILLLLHVYIRNAPFC
jgi:hypothetical protein